MVHKRCLYRRQGGQLKPEYDVWGGRNRQAPKVSVSLPCFHMLILQHSNSHPLCGGSGRAHCLELWSDHWAKLQKKALIALMAQETMVDGFVVFLFNPWRELCWITFLSDAQTHSTSPGLGLTVTYSGRFFDDLYFTEISQPCVDPGCCWGLHHFQMFVWNSSWETIQMDEYWTDVSAKISKQH